jgi:hypothetical protein
MEQSQIWSGIKKYRLKKKFSGWSRYHWKAVCPTIAVETQYGIWDRDRWSFLKVDLSCSKNTSRMGFKIYLEILGAYFMINFYDRIKWHNSKKREKN